MIVDARQCAQLRNLDADVCIVGTGPAACTIAHGYLGTGTRVTLLESGGVGHDAIAQELNAGSNIGSPYSDLRRVRHRQVGGTVNIWNTEIAGERAAKYVPLDAIDLEPREWLPHCSWPFGMDELIPWYRRAQTFCGLGAFNYDSRHWTETETAPFDLDHNVIASRVYQFGPAGRILGAIDALVADPCVQLVHHATAVELVCASGTDRVDCVSVMAPGLDAPLSVRARTFVLAAGALENARLLLLSDRYHPNGLGNQHDLVGRYFMEHPRDYALELLPRSASFRDDARFYDQHAAADGTIVMGRLALAEETLRRTRSLQASGTLLPVDNKEAAIVRFLRALPGGARSLAHWRRESSWSLRKPARRKPDRFRLLLNLEQAPSRENRVVLGTERDAYGRRRLQLHWNWTAEEHKTLQRTRRHFADALEAAGLGTVSIRDGSPDPNAHHHSGTTRMHVDPRHGVVDADSRVHSVENLYIAGASVFPASGFANPTLTICAMAARLGQHLRS